MFPPDNRKAIDVLLSGLIDMPGLINLRTI